MIQHSEMNPESFGAAWFTRARLVLHCVAALLILAAFSSANADQLFRHPDGSTEILTSEGDTDFVFFRDEAGYSLIKVKDHFEYAVIHPQLGHLVPSGHIKGQADPTARGIPPGVQFSSRRIRGIGLNNNPGGPTFQAPKGEFNILIIPMRFADHRDRQVPDRETLHRIFNREGGDPEYAPAGSVRDYMHEVSYGQLTLNFTVTPWVDLPKTENYYAQWEPVRTIANGYRIDEACFYALGAADTDWPQLDLSQFDRNKDGYIDAIGFLHSGYGSEAGGNDPAGVSREGRIASMQYSLTEWTSRTGLKVRKVAVASSLFSNKGGRPVRVGVLSHEAGHMMGLPDLYNTRSHYQSDVGAGIGWWGILGDSWGFDQSQHYPLHMSPWSKAMLGWVEPKVIDQSGEFTIRAAERTPDIYRIDRGFPPGEYLLIENRQPVGFDQQIPPGSDGVRGGLAVWHIDDRKIVQNDVGYPGLPGFPQNNAHLRVALLQADGRFNLERNDNKGDGDDLFRSTGVSRIGPDGLLNTNAYQLGVIRRTGIHIHSVSESAETMTFRVDFGGSGDRLAQATEHRGNPPTQPEPQRQPVAGRQSGPASEPPAAKPQPASAEEPTILREVKVTLDRPGVVSITGTAVLRSTVARQTAAIALARDTSIWRTSRRLATFPRTDQVIPVTTRIVREFPAGTHTLRLILSTPEGRLDSEEETSLTAFVVGADGSTTRASRNVASQTRPSTADSGASGRPYLTFIDLDAPRRTPLGTANTAGSTVATVAQSASRPVPQEIVWTDLGTDKPAGFNQPGTVGSLTLNLQSPADVVFSAGMSFASPGERNAFVIGLSESDTPSAPFWPDSQQTSSTTFCDQCQNVGSKSVKRLSAGTHTVHWRITPQGESPTYAVAGGIITAEVFPVSSQRADLKE